MTTKKCICPTCGDSHVDPTPVALRALLGRMESPIWYMFWPTNGFLRNRAKEMARRTGIW